MYTYTRSGCYVCPPPSDEDVIALQKILTKRGITELYHFTTLDNYKSIIRDALRIREAVSSASGITRKYMDELRLDGQIGTCLSISFPNSKLWSSYIHTRHRKEEWVLLMVSPEIILKLPCLFYPSNAASTVHKGKWMWDFMGASGLERLFSDVIESTKDNYIFRSEQQYLLDKDPTDIQAEVMCFDTIERQYIKGAFVLTEDVWNQVVTEEVEYNIPTRYVSNDIYHYSSYRGTDGRSIARETQQSYGFTEEMLNIDRDSCRAVIQGEVSYILLAKHYYYLMETVNAFDELVETGDLPNIAYENDLHYIKLSLVDMYRALRISSLYAVRLADNCDEVRGLQHLTFLRDINIYTDISGRLLDFSILSGVKHSLYRINIYGYIKLDFSYLINHTELEELCVSFLPNPKHTQENITELVGQIDSLDFIYNFKKLRKLTLKNLFWNKDKNFKIIINNNHWNDLREVCVDSNVSVVIVDEDCYEDWWLYQSLKIYKYEEGEVVECDEEDILPPCRYTTYDFSQYNLSEEEFKYTPFKEIKLKYSIPSK
ncbi:MAG: DarT ssDNA thymidine ADP-ribosyltransferase family protein [Moraxella sp.]|nr:DarT ssDNA thymidine ADP-ribosyltransferase family protein [Moraxella sp.]